MIAVTDLEIRIGARVLMSQVNFRVARGDKIGLVGRNGAGKTTLTKILAGDGQPSNASVRLATCLKIRAAATQKNSPRTEF